VIVVDASAVVAILFGEPAAEALAKRIDQSQIGARFMSTATYFEAGTVLAGRRKKDPFREIEVLDGFLTNSDIELVPVDADQARIALRARIDYGRGFGAAAGLNFGDCFSYALAKSKNAPLLYVGNDFDKTDIKPALKLRT
jgi:ribonuclease VapC